MTDEKKNIVTMRVRVGEAELEVTGPRDFVEDKIAEFLKSAKSLGGGPAKTPTEIPGPSSDGVKTPTKPTSIGQFMKKLALKTDVDRALAAGYYLEKSKGYDSYTAAEINATIKGAKIPPPGNTNNVIDKNIKKGFMMSAGDKEKRKAFVLTTDGEQFIDDMIESAG